MKYALELAIANAINEDRDCGAYGSVCVREIMRVRVRPGFAELEVDLYNADMETVVIPATPVFNVLLSELLSGDYDNGG